MNTVLSLVYIKMHFDAKDSFIFYFGDAKNVRMFTDYIEPYANFLRI